MASLPHQQHQQSAAESSSSGQGRPPAAQDHRRSSLSQSLDSEDSQTVLLNPPPPPDPSENVEKTRQPSSEKPKLKRSRTSKEPKICWICFSDETEDTLKTSRWRSPCPCALKAHEACLLDWVADLESPGKPPKPIECPQCKTKLLVQRPRSIVADMAVSAHHIASEMTYPCLVATLAGTVIMSFWLHGLGTVYIVFGHRDANRVLGLDLPTARLDSNWGLAMPFIPLGLIASRMNTPNLDQMLGILSAGYFYSFRDVIATWPPSPSTTMAAMGCVLPSYKMLYRRYVVPLQDKWMKEVKPRSGSTSRGDDGDDQNNRNDQNDQDGINVGIELQIDVEEDVEEDIVGGEQQADGQQNEAPANAAAQLEQNLGEARNREQHVPVAEAPAAPPQRREHLLDINLLSFSQKIMGALLFPSVAAAVGQALKTVLPRTWTSPPTRGLDRYSPGFLQSQFGRTVIGGCLCVVFKDALQMYAAYHLAMSHRQRKVANYEDIPARLRKRTRD